MKFLNTFLLFAAGWRLAKRNRRIVRRSGRKSPSGKKKDGPKPPPRRGRSTTPRSRPANTKAIKALAKRITHEGLRRATSRRKNHPPAGRTRGAGRGQACSRRPAHWYWQYFLQNRYRFMQRTATAEPLEEDFTVDLPRLYREIDLTSPTPSPVAVSRPSQPATSPTC